ncbi:MAG: hypothetical protein MZU79_02410 [Anaerotruncus sp.]|nr:hypothetical protein [Anaerotruncus sp.]
MVGLVMIIGLLLWLRRLGFRMIFTVRLRIFLGSSLGLCRLVLHIGFMNGFGFMFLRFGMSLIVMGFRMGFCGSNRVYFPEMFGQFPFLLLGDDAHVRLGGFPHSASTSIISLLPTSIVFANWCIRVPVILHLPQQGLPCRIDQILVSHALAFPVS